MKTRNIPTILLLAVVAAFTSCANEESDNEKPLIVLTSPAEEEAVLPGSDIYFEATLSDNEALASYKVNIHGVFDGHTHNAAVSGAIRNDHAVSSDNGVEIYGIGTRAATDSVAFEKTWLESDFIALGEIPIAGRKQANVSHQHIVIPAIVNGQPLREGHYHFIVYCTDQAGQESFIAREIEISYDAEEHLH